ncbi:hypothetical protein GCM10007391_09180 [Alteromonas halophila]|uniref:histidine kinase n=2 Tax=Alteromonas halophila TaxID=516698 RepID=A0A918MWT9_9ALTE|nr:hybrid sensor histidine kinase/response regulator [Alteromonas halophila]GGW78714.1 hypothetical protein GCM10007391_09180 [Alteromonas halophila]
MLLAICTHANAQQTVQLFDEEAELELADSLSYLYESTTPLTIDDIIRRRGEFQRYVDGNPNFGFHDRGMWLQVSISNVSNLREWVFSVNFSQLDKVDFYLVQNGEVKAFSHQGKAQPDQTFRMPTFGVNLPYAEAVELYMRVESESSSLIVPLQVEPRKLHNVGFQIDSLLWGLFYGGLIILAIYNLVLYFEVREPSLLAYVGYLSAVVLWQLVWGGHVHLFTSGQLPDWLISHTELIFVLIGISSGIFTLTFLETRKNASFAHPFVKFLLITQALIGLICLPDLLPHIWKNNLVYGIGMLAICSYIFAGFEAFYKRFQPARYFIFAWTMLATGAIVGMLSLVGILPSNDFTTYCFQVGVFLESGLFSLALMEKSRSQLESEVEQATNDLRNNMELIEEQNARLDIARKDAIKASNVKSQFLANMSHEIRTPLNAILGFSRELTQAALPSDQQEQVRIINTAADNLLSIVNDVLDFSKIEAGKLTINNQPFSPNQLLEEMVTIMSKSAHTKRLEFVFELGPLPEKLIGDVFRIKQILNNLLSNAIKFTSSGMVTLSARAKPLAHGIHELEFKVEDSGIGISRKDKKKLFNAFSQVEDAINRSYQGTGLGLVICRELVRLMRGNITLKSVPNVGSTFTVTLKTNQLSQKFALTPNEDWQGKKVVVFDPVPDTRRASAHLLACMGADVYAVESVEFLRRLNVTSDYLLATVPVSKIAQRDALLAELVEIPAQKRILCYSGPEPFSQYPSLQNHFISQLRMPLTISKLDSIVHQREKVNRNPMQDKLDSLPKARILAVDDMDMNLKLLHTWLDNSPVMLTTSMSGQDAVNRCQTAEFDLILMDVQMPGMDGLQASRGIRQTPLNMGTPIIAVTAHAFKEEQERLLASGMDDYLPKPIDLANLLDLVRRWCQNIEPVKMALPTLDWQLAMQRTNHNQAATEELLNDFLTLLPGSIENIRQQWDKRNYDTLKSEIHRLHGACCYTGVPKLQDLARDLESALKLGQHFLVAEHMPALILEAEIILAEGQGYLDKHQSSGT